MPQSAKKPNVQTQIDRMVKRIVRSFRPEKIILFGSHARGDAGPDSDVDLLVVMPVEGSVAEKRLEIRMALRERLGITGYRRHDPRRLRMAKRRRRDDRMASDERR